MSGETFSLHCRSCGAKFGHRPGCPNERAPNFPDEAPTSPPTLTKRLRSYVDPGDDTEDRGQIRALMTAAADELDRLLEQAATGGNKNLLPGLKRAVEVVAAAPGEPTRRGCLLAISLEIERLRVEAPLVERLREASDPAHWEGGHFPALLREAADEIDRLGQQSPAAAPLPTILGTEQYFFCALVALHGLLAGGHARGDVGEPIAESAWAIARDLVATSVRKREKTDAVKDGLLP